MSLAVGTNSDRGHAGFISASSAGSGWEPGDQNTPELAIQLLVWIWSENCIPKEKKQFAGSCFVAKLQMYWKHIRNIYSLYDSSVFRNETLFKDETICGKVCCVPVHKATDHQIHHVRLLVPTENTCCHHAHRQCLVVSGTGLQPTAIRITGEIYTV